MKYTTQRERRFRRLVNFLTENEGVPLSRWEMMEPMGFANRRPNGQPQTPTAVKPYLTKLIRRGIVRWQKADGGRKSYWVTRRPNFRILAKSATYPKMGVGSIPKREAPSARAVEAGRTSPSYDPPTEKVASTNERQMNGAVLDLAADFSQADPQGLNAPVRNFLKWLVVDKG